MFNQSQVNCGIVVVERDGKGYRIIISLETDDSYRLCVMYMQTGT